MMKQCNSNVIPMYYHTIPPVKISHRVATASPGRTKRKFCQAFRPAGQKTSVGSMRSSPREAAAARRGTDQDQIDIRKLTNDEDGKDSKRGQRSAKRKNNLGWNPAVKRNIRTTEVTEPFSDKS